MTNQLVSYAPSNLAELEDWAKRYATAFHGQYRGKPQDVVLAVMWGAELGLQPMQALRSIAVINSKPSVYGDDLVGLAEKYGKIKSRREGFLGKPYDDDFRAWCECTTPNGDVFRQEFSVADATLAGLWRKAGPWQTNPKRMLQFRARNFCVRDAAPDLGLGPSAEEMREVEDDETRATKARDVTPPRQHEDGTPLTPHEEVDAANEQAAEPERIARAEAELALDPLGLNGSPALTAAQVLVARIGMAPTTADAEALYDTYRPRIAKMPAKYYDTVAAAMAKRIEDDYPARAAAQREFLEDEGKPAGPDE